MSDSDFVVTFPIAANNNGEKSRLRLPSREAFYDEVIDRFPVEARTFRQVILPRCNCSFYFVIDAKESTDFDMPYFVKALFEEVQKLQGCADVSQDTVLMNYGKGSNICIGVCQKLLFHNMSSLFMFAFRLCRRLFTCPDSARLTTWRQDWRRHAIPLELSVYGQYAEMPLLWNLPHVGAKQQLLIAPYNRFAATHVTSPRELFVLCTIAQTPIPIPPTISPPTPVEWHHPISPALGSLLLDQLKSWGNNANATIDRVEKARNWKGDALFVSFLDAQRAPDHQHAVFAIIERRALRIHWFCYKREGEPRCSSVKQDLPIQLAMSK
jgi:hypothetical protein